MLFYFKHGCDKRLFRYEERGIEFEKLAKVLDKLVRRNLTSIGIKCFYEIYNDICNDLIGEGCVEQKGFGYERVAITLSMVYKVIEGLGFEVFNTKSERVFGYYPLFEKFLEKKSYLKEEKSITPP